jgi:hypothetical protein
MNPERQHAIEYLRAPANGLWRWAENGAVLVWRDGTTIAFREEIVQVIEWLAPNGLPSFGAIVFLFAACRGKVTAVADIVVTSNAPLPAGMGKDATLLVSARQQLQAQLAAALAQLEKVSQLPGELNTGVKAKCVLAEAVFEPAKVERYVEARTVLRGLRELMSDAELVDADHAAVSGSYIRQVHIVSEGLKLHTAESLALRLRTGLDALPNAVEADLPSAERARRLIEELSRDREYGAVGRAARELMAAVRLPRRLGEREQLALGGVSDITNRGPLDRLLLSELAHDDLTLSVRVALNEALYLRREPPMREPPGAVALLLDSGVRLWGTPRVLATAVALALIARDKQHSEVLAWRAQGKKLQQVDLLSRHGLTEHLSALEPAAHAGESVAAFAEAASSNARNQSVLITHRDALADPEFRRALADNPAAPGFVATVDRDGRFELHAMPLAHRPPLCEADLDLAALFDDSMPVAPIKTDVDPNLPAIFGVSPFPFLLPVAGKVDFWITGADGFTYATLRDRRLVRYRNPRSGVRVLSHHLPGAKTIWMDCDGSEVYVVKGSSHDRPARLLSLTLPHGQLRVTDLASGPEVQAAYRYGDAIVLIRPNDLRAYSLSDGRLLGTALNPHAWVHGRYFRGANHFYFAVWDGESVKFEPVSLPSNYLASSVAAIFDREGHPGPWILCNSGEAVSTESGEVIKLPRPDGHMNFRTIRVSRNGQQLLVRTSGGDVQQNRLRFCLIDLEKSPKNSSIQFSHAFADRPPTIPTWNIYRVIDSVAVLKDGVGLCGRKVRWRKLWLDDQGKLRIIQLAPSSSSRAPDCIFKPPQQTKHGCTLQVAEIAGGSKLFLDSRGLLHFKSSNSDVPEVSVVLADGEVAAWTSDGYVCGPSFFFDGPITSDPKRVFERIMNFFTKL